MLFMCKLLTNYLVFLHVYDFTKTYIKINLNAAVDDIVMNVYTANGDEVMNLNGTNDDSN